MSVFERGVNYRPQNERRRRLGRAAAVTLAASTALASTGIFIADKLNNTSGASTIDNANQGLMNIPNGPDCPPVDPAVLEVVKTIFSTKDPKELKKISPDTPNKYDKYVRDQAERFGVTLHNPNSALEKLFISETVDDALAGFNDFIAGFGYTATIPTETDEHDRYEGLDVVPSQDLDPLKFAVGAYSAIKTLQYLPTEVAKLAGDVEIRFVRFPVLEGETVSQVVGLATFEPRKIYVDMDAFYTGHDYIIPHEIGHQIDVNSCGVDGYRVDSEYSSLNPSDFEYLDNTLFGQVDENDEALVERTYGLVNIAEDKAVLLEQNLVEAEGFGKMSPVLRSKFELIIARIEEHTPRYAGFLRSISARNREN